MPAESILSQPASSIIEDFLIIISPVNGCFTSEDATPSEEVKENVENNSDGTQQGDSTDLSKNETTTPPPEDGLQSEQEGSNRSGRRIDPSMGLGRPRERIT